MFFVVVAAIAADGFGGRVFLFGWFDFGETPNSAQDLLPALCPGITPGRAWEPYVMLGIRMAACKASILSVVLPFRIYPSTICGTLPYSFLALLYAPSSFVID